MNGWSNLRKVLTCCNLMSQRASELGGIQWRNLITQNSWSNVGYFLSRSQLLVLSMCVVTFFGSVQSQSPVEAPMRIGVILPTGIEPAPLPDAVTEAARMGAIMAEEEFSFNAELLGMELDVLIESVSSQQAALQTAEELVTDEGVFALIGGFGEGQALALRNLAEEHQILFFNIGSPNDTLRNEACSRYTFHVEPSAAMYLDALAGWYIRSGFRNWFFVHEDSVEGETLYRRAISSLRERHFGAREVGRSVVAPNALEFNETIEAVRRARPGVVLLLLDPADQLTFLEQYEAAGLEAAVTGFPHPAAQTRTFFDASRTVALTAGAGHRATSWEATLDRYGARELNSRFLARWNQPMEPSAWAAYQAVKILYEAALLGGTLEGPELVEHLESPQAVFDIWKGIGASFRPWDHQLRQSLFLVKISSDAEEASNVAALVGELPAIYMPGTDPVERLDQLGDLQRESRCRF
jgi:ABC-type branched-subunit amino acid transport system substrate-binding protein